MTEHGACYQIQFIRLSSRAAGEQNWQGCWCDSRALCYLKLQRFGEAKQDCDAALELEPDNKKAFFRRALANKGLQVSTHKRRASVFIKNQRFYTNGPFACSMNSTASLCVRSHQDYLACSSDLQEVLQLDPNVQEAEKELEEVTVLLRQSLASATQDKPRKTVAITEVRLCSVSWRPGLGRLRSIQVYNQFYLAVSGKSS